MRGFRRKEAGIPSRSPPSAPQPPPPPPPPPYTSLAGPLLGCKKSTAAHRYHNMHIDRAPYDSDSHGAAAGSAAAAAAAPDDADAAGSSRAGPPTIPTGAGDAGPLSVHAAAVGLVAAASRAHGDAAELDTQPGGKTAALRAARRALADFKLTAQLLHKHLRRVERGALARPARAALVDVDVLVAVLTAAVMTVAEFEARLEDLAGEARALGVPPADVCRRFARALAKDANRIDVVDFIVTKLLSVLQVSDEAEAMRHRAQAQESVMDMLQSDIALAARMATLDDPFAARAAVPAARIAEVDARPPPGYSVPAPTSDAELAELPDYAAAAANADGSVTIRPTSWSLFSGLHLADVRGAVRRVPIPIAHQEIRCGAEFYAPGFADQVHDALGELAEQNTKHKAKALLQILGQRDPGDASSGHAGFVRRIAAKYGGPALRLSESVE